MLLLKLVNAVWCEVYLYLDWVDAGEAYNACLQISQSTTEARECYSQFLTTIGETSLEYFSCLF